MRSTYFYPRSPCGERRRHYLAVLSQTLISIHALLAESDFGALEGLAHWCAISIHALLAESDVRLALLLYGGHIFLSTLSLRRATTIRKRQTIPIIISIHALLAESDGLFMLYDTSALLFLSTLSLRRATIVTAGLLMCSLYFYPRSPCGERHKSPQGRR